MRFLGLCTIICDWPMAINRTVGTQESHCKQARCNVYIHVYAKQ